VGKLLNYVRILYAWKARKRQVNNYIPEDISVELTNACNFRCSFCPQSDPKHFEFVSRSELRPEQAEVVLAKLRAGGVKTNVIHWTLDGEPFLNNKINEICSLAIRYGWRSFIFSTNGFFCTPERVGSLPINSQGITYALWIDFCADEELFEKHRGVPKSWAKIRDNILRILGNEQFNHISITLTDIASFVITDKDDLKRRLLMLKNIFPKSDRLTVTTRIFHNAAGFVPGMLEKKKMLNSAYNLCPYPWTSMVIAANGDVVACCRDLEHKTVLGNIFAEDLVSIWNGQKYQNLRQELANKNPQAIKACATCDLPYDQDKFTIRHLLMTGIRRLGIFKRGK
jgi:radical SAM protein with 4Fe4S-binding SPASM domain